MNQQQGDDFAQEAARLLDRAIARMERVEHMERSCVVPTTMQTTTIGNINTGWLIAALCVSVMCALTTVVILIFGSVIFLDQARKVDRMQDYWNVTIQYVPGLKDQLHKEEKIEHGNRGDTKAAN